MIFSDVIPWLFALATLFYGVYQYLHRKKDIRQRKMAEFEAIMELKEMKMKHAATTAEEIYSTTLRWELGSIGLLGSPDIESRTARLEDAYVSVGLRMPPLWRSEDRFDASKNRTGIDIYEESHYLSPEEVMNRAFTKYKLLLVIGDPGSGKTTLMKYYAMICLDKKNKKYRQLGFDEEIFPIYFPLRELEFSGESGDPVSLPDSLAQWAKWRVLDIPADQFQSWLQKRNTLLLLDGLDEISSMEKRRKVCQWIKNMSAGLKNARFVVTSRPTGYRKLDGIELEMPYLRADIMDFSLQQQELFLKRWFRAVFLSDFSPAGMKEEEWNAQQEKRAYQQSQMIIDFLKHGENKPIMKLAAVPMLLQIMALIWKDRRYLPKTRLALYDAALNYLLEYRDRQKDIAPLLPAEEARRVLAPTALWMQEILKRDEVPKVKMHEFMQPILNSLAGQPRAEVFCEHLRDRAGLIVDYDRENYIFRHNSFREYLAGIQLKEEVHRGNQLETLIGHFKDAWWDETLRFFMGKADAQTFDRFMYLFFQSPVSEQLNDNQQTLLQNLVKDALLRKIDALVACLNNDKLSENRRKYVLDCLKTIGTPETFQAIETANKENWNKINRAYAEDIIAEAPPRFDALEKRIQPEGVPLRSSFRNSFEDNVEYIHIPGGDYTYSVTDIIQTVPDFYLCKYPVTNKRYRRFISFLAGSEKELLKILPLEIFAQRLLKFATPIKGYTAFLGENFTEWQIKLPSRLDDDKKFNGDDQPAVAVSWYAARAYCFWLSCLEIAMRGDNKFENMDIHQLASIYKLPTEKEWEWAAAGRESDGSPREYPWPAYKGEPTPNLANYSKNVGATTPVGRCPEGATPDGLMDMAGNAWEWMDNYYDAANNWYALRGGSWYDGAHHMRCAARSNGGPDYQYDVIGFRVLHTYPG